MAYQPKSYKKFVATAATATLVASAIAPVASAASFSDVADRYKEAVSYLADKGISQGYPNGKFGTDDNIKRQDAAVMIAKALGASPTGNYANAGFTDVPADRQWAVNFLVEKKIVSGKAAAQFGANDFTTRGEMAKIIANAYNFVGDATNAFPFTDVSETFKQYVDALNEAGVAQGLTATQFGTGENVTRGQFALFVFRAETLNSELTALDFVTSNQKEFHVTFNKAVDELTAQTEGNYELKLNNQVVAADKYEIEVDADNAKRVNITLTDAAAESITNGSFLTLTVSEDVLDTNLKPLADEFTKTVTFNDVVGPTVSKVEVDGDNLVVTFNDYVETVGLVTVNGVNKSAVVSGARSKEVVVTNGAVNLANGTYTVQFANVADIASPVNVTSFTSGTFTLSDDVTVPSVEKLTQVDNDTFKIVFNKGIVAPPTVTVKRNGLPLTITAINATGKANEYTVDVADNGPNKLYDTNASSTTVAVEVSAYKDTNNTVGNAYTNSFTFTKDTVAPTVVTRFNTVTGTSFDVRFNEEVTLEDVDQIVFRDKDGVRQDVSAVVVDDTDGDATILRITSDATSVVKDSAVVAGTYNITLGAGTVEDLEGNANATTNVSIVKSSSAAGTVTANAEAAGNIIQVNYGAAMSATATTAANYRLNNGSLPAGSVLYFNGNKQTVIIELPAGSIASSGQAALTITDSVVSEAGSKVATADRNLVTGGTGLTDNVKPSLVSAKKASSTTIELTFSEKLSTVANTAETQNDFVVKVNGVDFTVSAVTDGTDGDNKLTLVVPSYNVNQTVTVTTSGTALTVADSAGNTVNASTAVTAIN